ncbi:hypothetical protein DSY4561 [Desulfitobacterium hafniense Y51]|uniref:Uncharacterized protein n=1 Tax=Desulfitobacterium hafniense (strain Y51) TaxID=138119 RepID=Q24NP2_DESHY|nr:hypothetical protein DSY4561 [Desulfitobacterium hafniense Y51]
MASRLRLYSSIRIELESFTAPDISQASMVLAAFRFSLPAPSMALAAPIAGSSSRSARIKNSPAARRIPVKNICTSISVTSCTQWAWSA